MKITDFIGAWKGNDLDDCLESVYNNRGLIMFNKYKYKACQCLCHYKYEKYIAIECKCGCKPDSEIIKENKEWGELYLKSIDAYNKIYEENKQLFEAIEQLKAENEKLKASKLEDMAYEVICPRIKELEAQLDKTNKFYKGLKEENESLKNNKQLYKDFFQAENYAKLNLQMENARLKAENEQLKSKELKPDNYCFRKAESGANGLKADSGCGCNWCEVIISTELNDFIIRNYKHRYYLEEENELLKANNEELLKNYWYSVNKYNDSANNIPLREINCPDCNPERKPHRCPICNGFGTYPSLTAQEVSPCHSCNNTGIVWEPE